MTKKRISSVDLSWIITERLKEDGSFPTSISLAVVADSREGWRVVVANRSRKYVSAQSDRQLAALQKRLRLLYELANG